MKWIWVIVLVIIGALATYVAIEYFTVSIHALPSYIPGHESVVHGHPARGHYRKRGAAAALVAFVAFVAAAFLAFRIVKRGQAAAPAAAPTAGAPSASDIV